MPQAEKHFFTKDKATEPNNKGVAGCSLNILQFCGTEINVLVFSFKNMRFRRMFQRQGLTAQFSTQSGVVPTFFCQGISADFYDYPFCLFEIPHAQHNIALSYAVQ